jgi:adenylate kinase family enzyme
VGPCGAGKSTLAAHLQKSGFRVKSIAQEHSYVSDMWQRLTKPDILIYLEVSFENTILRRNLNWTISEYEQQLYRLRHARQNAHLVIDTNPFTPAQIQVQVVEFLESLGIAANNPNPI